MLLPLAEALVVVSESDAVRTITHPVHGPQSGVVEGSFAQVVFEDDRRARDAGGIAEELRDVAGVVKHVDEEANVEGTIEKGKLRAVERPALDSACGARLAVCACRSRIGPGFLQQVGEVE